MAKKKSVTLHPGKKNKEALFAAEQEKILILESVEELIVFPNRKMQVLWANRTAAESVQKSSRGV